jgi:acetyl-CoA C-acetyltransferase
MHIDPQALSPGHEMLHDFMMGLITLPGSYAYKAVRYMHLYGTKPEYFAQVSVKNHKNSCLNPNAMYQKGISIEEVLNSRMISYPLTLYQCCANSSGSAAVILCSEKKARQYTDKPVFLTGWGAASLKYDRHDPVETSLSEGNTESAARKAYEKAGIGPEEVNLAQVHDAFSIGEILQIEALGFCPKGEGAALTWEGNTAIDGKIPVNTDGGLIGCGHPIGASGCRMIAEIYWQLRGQAGSRQVKNHRVGLLQNSGLGATNVMVFQV